MSFSMPSKKYLDFLENPIFKDTLFEDLDFFFDKGGYTNSTKLA